MKRPNLRIMGIEEGKEIQTEGIGNPFSKIVAENFPKPKKENIQEAYKAPNCQDQKRKYSQEYHNQNTQHKEQRKNTGGCKREKTSHILKANPLE
jgi:hypothetical protein